jgi:hypothetical protein
MRGVGSGWSHMCLVKWSGPTCRHESWLQCAGRVEGLGEVGEMDRLIS